LPVPNALVDLHIIEDVVYASGTITVRWDTKATDLYHDLRHWDFLALHCAGTNPEEYEASIYMLGIECGEVQFCSPLVDGSYAISAVRDLKILYRNLPPGDRKRALQSQLDNTLSEQFIQLGALDFEVRSKVVAFKR